MRILLTADPELPVPPKLYGGIERIVDILVREFRQLGHEVALVAHHDSTSPATRLCPWPGLRSQNRWDILKNTFALHRAARKFKPDVLHSFSRLAYLLPFLLTPHSALRTPRLLMPFLLTPRSALRTPHLIMSYQRQPTERQIKRASKLAGQSLAFTGCSEHICRQGRAGGGTWHAIHNCVELAKYDFQPRVPSDAPLVFLSRVERIKGAHTAIAIAKRASRRLLIAGNHGSTGEEGRYWETEILPHLGKNGIEYVGPVDDAQKNRLLGQAAAMLVPIEWDEPFGIVFAEALACGTPVISCPRGALPEIVREGQDGFLVNTVDEACAAVAKIPAINRATCRQRAAESFSSRVISGRYENLYRRLIQSPESKIT